MTLSGQDAKGWLGAEINKLPPEITLILRHVLIERRGQSRIVPGGGFCVVIDEIDTSGIGKSHFPTTGQGSKL